MSPVILPLMWNIYCGTCRIDCGLLRVFLLWRNYDSGEDGGSWGEVWSLRDLKQHRGPGQSRSERESGGGAKTAEPMAWLRPRPPKAKHIVTRQFMSCDVNIKVCCNVMTELFACFSFSLRTSSSPTSPSSPTAASLCRPAATSPSRRCNGPTPATISARRWRWQAASWPRPNWRSQMVRLERLQQMHLLFHIISSGFNLPNLTV